MAVTMIVSLVSAQFSAFGGGGDASHAAPDGSGSGSGTGMGSSGACGLPQATGASSAGPAEGAWTGSFPYLFGRDVTFGGGIVAADGAATFNVANREFWVGSVPASEEGAVASDLTRCERQNTGGPGGPRSAGPPIPEALAFDRAAPHATPSGAYAGPLSDCQDLSLRYDSVYEHATSLQEIAGVYAASEDDGYTLTVTIHDDGQLDGSDTRGCVLIGNLTVPDAARNVYRATATASACGDLDAEYGGVLSLRFSENRLSWLDLALAARTRQSSTG